jgi:hypothetical protein
MGDAGVHDLAALDRDVARGWSALGRWRRALASDPDAHADETPLEAVRNVAGKSTWDALGATATATTATTTTTTDPRSAPARAAPTMVSMDASLRDGLRRWVYALLQARLGRDGEVAWARAASDARTPFEGDPPRLVGWREAWRGVVAARGVGEARLWLEAAADAGPRLAAVDAERARTRVEAARRLGFAHPWDALAPAPRDALRPAAARLLDATEDLARDLRRRRFATDARAADVMHDAVAREAGAGWPARLTARWLHELFGAGVRGLRIDLPPLPATLGAASFARALGAFGHAFAVAAASDSPAPFAITHEPWDVRAHRAGYVFASLAADPELYVRALGVGRGAAQAQARALAWVALLEARLGAARLLLGDDAAPAPADLFEELGARLYGAPLDRRLRGAWPRARDDEPARFAALVQTRAAVDDLRERFDVDWFRNPRAWTELRAAHAGPARETTDGEALLAAAAALARGLQEALA